MGYSSTRPTSPCPSLSQLLKQAIKYEAGSLMPPPGYNQNSVVSGESHSTHCWVEWSKCVLETPCSLTSRSFHR